MTKSLKAPCREHLTIPRYLLSWLHKLNLHKCKQEHSLYLDKSKRFMIHFHALMCHIRFVTDEEFVLFHKNKSWLFF